MSFTPSIADPGFEAADLSAWSVAGTASVMPNGSVWAIPDAPEGVQSCWIYDGGAVHASVSQVVDFGPGGTFTLGGYFCEPNYEPHGVGVLSVRLDGSEVLSYSDPNASSAWFAWSCTFTLASGTHVLSFVNVGADSSSLFVDGLVLSVVSLNSPPPPPPPPPVTWGKPLRWVPRRR